MIYNKLKSTINYFKNKDSFPTGLELDFGPRGCGKTAYCAKLFYRWSHNKLPFLHFYSNVTINTDNPEFYYLDLIRFKLTDYLDPNDKIISRYRCSTYDDNKYKPHFFIKPYSIIFLDELGCLYQNRQYKTFPKELITFIKLLRKYKIYIVGNSQNYDIDLALKNGSNDIRLMSKVGLWTISRKVNKWPGLVKSSDQDKVSADSIMDVVEFAPILQKDALHITFIPFYTDLFNTNE